MRKNRFFIVLGSVVVLATTVLLWRDALLAALVLAVIDVGMLLYLKSKKYFIIFCYGFIFGPASEMLAIHFGVWSYAEPQFLGIPLWLPFVWGAASITIASVYARLETYERT